MKVLKLTLMGLIVPTLLHAGESGGGGGDALLCKGKFVVYDVVEGMEKGLQPVYPAGNYDQKVQALIARVEKLSAPFAEKLLSSYKKSFQEIYLRDMGQVVQHREVDLYNGTLLDIPDTGIGQIPAYCKPQIYQAAIQMVPNTDFKRLPFRYRVAKPIWDAMDLNQKVALTLHELILVNSRIAGSNDTTSVRHLNALILADKLPTTLSEKRELVKSLGWNEFIIPISVGKVNVRETSIVDVLENNNDGSISMIMEGLSTSLYGQKVYSTRTDEQIELAASIPVEFFGNSILQGVNLMYGGGYRINSKGNLNNIENMKAVYYKLPGSSYAVESYLQPSFKLSIAESGDINLTGDGHRFEFTKFSGESILTFNKKYFAADTVIALLGSISNPRLSLYSLTTSIPGISASAMGSEVTFKVDANGVIEISNLILSVKYVDGERTCKLRKLVIKAGEKLSKIQCDKDSELKKHVPSDFLSSFFLGDNKGTLEVVEDTSPTIDLRIFNE